MIAQGRPAIRCACWRARLMCTPRRAALAPMRRAPLCDVTADCCRSAAAVGCSNHEQTVAVSVPSITCRRYPQLIELKAEACTAVGAPFDRTKNSGDGPLSAALPCRPRCRSGEMGLVASPAARTHARPNSIQAAFGSRSVLWRLSISLCYQSPVFLPNRPNCTMTVSSFYFLVRKFSH